MNVLSPLPRRIIITNGTVSRSSSSHIPFKMNIPSNDEDNLINVSGGRDDENISNNNNNNNHTVDDVIQSTRRVNDTTISGSKLQQGKIQQQDIKIEPKIDHERSNESKVDRRSLSENTTTLLKRKAKNISTLKKPPSKVSDETLEEDNKETIASGRLKTDKSDSIDDDDDVEKISSSTNIENTSAADNINIDNNTEIETTSDVVPPPKKKINWKKPDVSVI